MSNVVEEIESKIRFLRPKEKTELLRSRIAELDGPPDFEAETESSARCLSASIRLRSLLKKQR